MSILSQEPSSSYFLSSSSNPILLKLKDPPDDSETELHRSLQTIILRQQAMIETLLERLNHSQDFVDEPCIKTEIKFEWSPIKAEADSTITPKGNLSESVNDCSETNLLSLDQAIIIPESHIQNNVHILRRNGFKRTQSPKTEDDHSLQGQKTSSKKASLKKTKVYESKSSSKAKHLWMNYGRRIVEYVVSETQDNMRKEVKQLVGVLNTKKDFKRAFQIAESDSHEDKTLKASAGKLAIDFVKSKALSTFEDLKHRESMILQRHVVAAWIERLIAA